MSAPIPEDLIGLHTEAQMRSEQDILHVRPSLISGLIERTGIAEDKLRRLPADWWQDSSLETWFPLTSEELERAKNRIAQLESDLAEAKALAQWRPITEDSLPNRGDEALRLPSANHGAMVIPVGFDSQPGDETRYLGAEFTHYRPIDPPKEQP